MGKLGRLVALLAALGGAGTGVAQAAPVDPAASFTVTPHAWVSGLDGRTNGPSTMTWCGNRDRGIPRTPCRGRWSSEQNWAVASRVDSPWPQAGFGLDDGPANAPASVGEPFVLAEFGHWNPHVNGDNPTKLAVHGDVVVQPPAGPPVTISLERLPRRSGFLSGFYLEFAETANVAPCRPDWQVSPTPCDDVFTLVGSPVEDEDQSLVSSADAGGVHWELEVLGWDNLRGGIVKRISDEEETLTVRSLYARVTASTTATATALGSDRATSTAGEPVTLTAAVSPIPTTGGTVAFADAVGAPVAGCAAVPVDVSRGVASCVTSGLSEGAHALTARFSGVVGFGASASSPVVVEVSAAAGGGEDPPSGGGDPPSGGEDPPGGGGDPPGGGGGSPPGAGGENPPGGGGGRGTVPGGDGGGAGDPAGSGPGGADGGGATRRPRLDVQRTTRAVLLRRGVAVGVSGHGRARLRLLDSRGGVLSRSVAVTLTARRRTIRLRLTRAARARVAGDRLRRLVVELRPAGARAPVRKHVVVVVRAPRTPRR